MKTIYIYPAVLLVGILVDAIWLGIISRGFYANQLGTLLKDKPNFLAAFLVYIILTLSLVFFTLNNNLASSYTSFALIGALFGFTVYAVYDLTNLATIDGYTLKVTLIDIIWGTTFGAILGAATKFFVNF